MKTKVRHQVQPLLGMYAQQETLSHYGHNPGKPETAALEERSNTRSSSPAHHSQSPAWSPSRAGAAASMGSLPSQIPPLSFPLAPGLCTGSSGHFTATAVAFPVKQIHLEEKRQLASAPWQSLQQTAILTQFSMFYNDFSLPFTHKADCMGHQHDQVEKHGKI